ncbi:MAG: PPOX class probable FMN-dependent enzyme [Yoonia sp.]|jgi:PPOX class probable FMN-dependent enzyme
MARVTDIATLEGLYGTPAKASIIKVADHITPHYAKWIAASRLCVLSTVGPAGTDGSPRGDDGPVVQIADPKTLLMPDWRGNNRMDSLRNIVADERVSLMFMVQGSNNVIRVNGTAEVRVDANLIARFDDRGRTPRSVIVINVAEIYSQCARALMRAQTWSGLNHSTGLPTIGDLLAEAEVGFDAVSYDTAWAARAEKTMW